jgi:hypothetical protein
VSEEPTTPAAKEKPINPLVVGIIMALVALFAPLTFSFHDYDGLHLSMVAVFWIFSLTPWGTYLETSNNFFLPVLMSYGLLRLAYAYQMVRLYKARTTKKRTLALGIVSELPVTIPLLEVLIVLLLNPHGPMALGGPTLILLIVGILIVRFKPPSKPPEIWEEMPEEKSWWVEESTNA